ncbi:MAG TPA: hypothetical protein VK540_31470 [Polyangiaceae bacterium]|nr:hypothetical protein [Polyangiaceae bacterium]
MTNPPTPPSEVPPSARSGRSLGKELAFATPRKLPKAPELRGRVVVLDVAFASEASGGGFDKITRPFIEGLGARLAMWVDHHDSAEHARFAGDPRFFLATKAEHGACPEMVTPDLVARAGQVDTIVCHTDFDGLASAAKWIRGGIEPYANADDDAWAIDTRLKRPGPIGERLDRALRARPSDHGLFGLVVRHLSSGLADASLWSIIDAAAAELVPIEAETRRVAEWYVRISPGVALVDVSSASPPNATPSRIDKTQLLLLGQEKEAVSVVIDRDTITVAARFDSGKNFLKLFGLSGGMPTRVSVPKSRLREVLLALGVAPEAYPV